MPDKSLLPGPVAALAGLIFQRGALLVVSLLALGAGGWGFAQDFGQSKIKAAVDAGVAPVQSELRTHIKDAEGKIETLRVEVTALRTAATAKEERDAARFDLLYRTILTGQPSSRAERLAQPTPAPKEDAGP